MRNARPSADRQKANPSRGSRRHSAIWRRRLAGILRKFAERIHPSQPDRCLVSVSRESIAIAAAIGRLDAEALEKGQVCKLYRATDALWIEPEGGDLVNVREHLRRLCLIADELSRRPDGTGWGDIAHHLQLGHSVEDVFASTDVDGAGLWCEGPAKFDEINSEFASRQLAATIVFTFVWTAYEAAIGLQTEEGAHWAPRGARGRDLLSAVDHNRLPCLRPCLFEALSLDHENIDHGHRDMRRMVRKGTLTGVAAEYLRQFRNRLVHGSLRMILPEDWDEVPGFRRDQDANLKRFHLNIRLVLLMIQLRALDLEDGSGSLGDVTGEGPSVTVKLSQIHCNIEPDHRQLTLDLDLPALFEPDDALLW